MLKRVKKKDPVENFWIWFDGNAARIRKFEENPDEYLGEIINELRKIKPGLVIELEPPADDIIKMTISADGNRELFPVVESIIEKAPQVDGWKFYAFRQRADPAIINAMEIKIGDYKLTPASMKFFPVIDGDALDIIVYMKGVNEENYNDMAYVGLLILDNILGEYDCVTRVQNYDFHDMPSQKQELNDLMPLLDLAAYVDKFHRIENP